MLSLRFVHCRTVCITNKGSILVMRDVETHRDKTVDGGYECHGVTLLSGQTMK